MDRQACTGDTLSVKSREMTRRSQTLPWWLGEEGKDDRKQYTLAPLADTHTEPFFKLKYWFFILRICHYLSKNSL